MILKTESKLILIWVVMLAAAAGGLVLILPGQYRAHTKVQIFIKPDKNNLISSADTLGTLAELNSVIESNEFYLKALGASVKFEPTYYFRLPKQKRAKQWANNVGAKIDRVNEEIQLHAYSPTPAEAELTVGAITEVLVLNASELVSKGVVLKVLRTPTVSKFEVRPNPIKAAAGGAVVGLIIALSWFKQEKN